MRRRALDELREITYLGSWKIHRDIQGLRAPPIPVWTSPSSSSLLPSVTDSLCWWFLTPGSPGLGPAPTRGGLDPETATLIRTGARSAWAPRRICSFDKAPNDPPKQPNDCATLSHMKIGVRELRNQTSQVIDAVRAGQRVVLTVHGEAVADIVPHGQRTRWLPGDHVRRELAARAADPGLCGDLEDLAGQTLDEL